MNRDETKMIQSLSVLALVCLHLFNRWDYQRLFNPVLFFKDIPLSFYLGQISDFCVMGFAFCSGYGHYKSYDSPNYYRKSLIRLFILYVNFWIILLLFTLISVLLGQGSFMPGSFEVFIKTFLTIAPAYNGAWWYLPVYAVIVLISPVVLKFSRKTNIWVLTFIFGAVYCLLYLYRYRWETGDLNLTWTVNFGITLSEYMIGVICCKGKIIEKIKSFFNKFSCWVVYLISAVVFVGMLSARTLLVPSLALAPVTGFVIICIFCILKKPKFVEKFLLFIANHSTNIWLVHMFFYSVLFKDLVYKAKYPLFIYLFMIALCLAASYIIGFIHNPIKKQIQKLIH